jgi:chromosome segregation ATPase
VTERTQELEAARAALAELKSHHAGVTQQVQSLTESLKSETSQRESAEKQSAELATRRTELEQELARRTQTQEQLHAELAEKQKQLAAQVQAHNVELNNLTERTKELEVARAALAELKSQHAQVTGQVEALTGQVRTLTESLKSETSQRESAEKQSAELASRRTELEQELARRTQTQEQLQADLTQKQQRIDAVVAELEEARNLAGAEALRQQQMAGQMAQSEQARAELDQQLNVARELSATRETAIRSLELELQKRRAEQQRLDGLLQTEVTQRSRLETQIETIQVQLDETSSHLAKKCADEQVWLGRESELQGRIRNQQDELAKSGATLTRQETEIQQARVKLEEFEMQRSALIGKVQSLTGQSQTLAASLTAETGRREVAEKNLAELIVRRTELEQEVASRAQAQEQLRVQLAEQVQAHTVEVANLAARTKELEASQMALADLKRQHAEVSASLAAETNQRAEAEQVWLGRESELQGRIRNQQDELAKSNLNLAGRELEIKDARKRIEELHVLQSALCAKVQDLTKLGEANAKTIQNLKTQVVYSDNAVKNSEQKLAGLRYAILDASRMNLRLHRERLHKERQNQEAMRRLLSSLAQTPLSLAQRGMIAELQHSVDSLKNSRTGALNTTIYPVELPGLRGSEFDFTEMVESAFQAVRAAATAAGVTAQVSVSGAIPHRLIGCAEHVHQLITLLAVSPLTITTGVNALDLRVAIKPKCVRFAEITLRAALACDGDARELLAHLTSVTTSASLQTGTLNEAEIGLATGWQLAEALGSQAVLEMDGNGEVCIVLSLPVEMDLQPKPAGEAAVYRPSLNGHVNGNGHHHDRNGQQTSDNNGYRLTEARAGVAD